MNIGQVAQETGLPAKTIRYYEDIALIHPARDPNGYRSFSEPDMHKLSFLARARTLGFTIEDCRALLALWEDRSRASADVKHIAGEHLASIEQKIEELKTMHKTLRDLVQSCAGDNRPDCPILSDLGQS